MPYETHTFDNPLETIQRTIFIQLMQTTAQGIQSLPTVVYLNLNLTCICFVGITRLGQRLGFFIYEALVSI